MKSTRKHSKRVTIISAIFLALLLGNSGTYAQVSVGITISARVAPPALPVYTQPPCPADGYLWTPGYWAYDDFDGYYWVPGVWVRPPMVGYLWTPSYWGYSGGVYGWHAGYWGPHIGFYGGVNYGYGYGGSGFGGGRWEGGAFRYNTAVMNVNTTVVHNTYIDRTVVVNNTTVVNNRTSFNGGPGGISARPSAQEQVAMRDRHVEATSEQATHQQVASRDRNQFARVNNGRPATTAMNTANGHRFDPQGHAAPPVVARASQPVRSDPQHAAAANQPHSTGGNPGVHASPANQSHPMTQHPAQQHPMAQQHAAPQQHQQPHPQPQHSNPRPGGGGEHRGRR